MGLPKNHHYVPAFYLNHWGKPEDESRYKEVQCFGFQDGKFIVSRKRTKSICSLEGLNLRESVQAAEVYKIEKFLADVDTKASEVHLKIIKAGPKSLSDEERSAYTSFLLSLKIRQPDAVKRMREYGDDFVVKELSDPSFLKEYRESTNNLDVPESPIDFMKQQIPDMIPNFGIDTMARIVSGENNSKFHNLFFNMIWFTKDFSVSSSIITCDNPHYSSEGLSHPKCIFAFPLTPTRFLFAVHSHEIRRKILKANSKYLADILNKTMAHQAFNRVIAQDEEHRELIKECFGKSRKPPLNLI